FGELAAAHARRDPRATAREFARHIAAVADAGLREEEAQPPSPAQAVLVVTLEAAREVEADHVYVLGLHAARIPGPSPTDAPVPEELTGDDHGGAAGAWHLAAQRRLLYVAMTRARRRLVLAYPERDGEGVALTPSPLV